MVGRDPSELAVDPISWTQGHEEIHLQGGIFFIPVPERAGVGRSVVATDRTSRCTCSDLHGYRYRTLPSALLATVAAQPKSLSQHDQIGPLRRQENEPHLQVDHIGDALVQRFACRR